MARIRQFFARLLGGEDVEARRREAEIARMEEADAARKLVSRAVTTIHHAAPKPARHTRTV